VIAPVDTPFGAILAGRREATDAETATRDGVLALCRAYRDGIGSLLDIRRYSTGRERFTAVAFTPLADPDRGLLLAVLDELVATDPTSADGWAYSTSKGVFTEADIRAAGGRTFRAEDGRIGVEFPASLPWERRPNRDRGDDGLRGRPVFRRDAEKAPRPMAAD